MLFASTLAEYKTKSACENQELKLHCQESKFLIIYSATYGRWAHEESVCSTKAEHTPPFGMFGHRWGAFSRQEHREEGTQVGRNFRCKSNGVLKASVVEMWGRLFLKLKQTAQYEGGTQSNKCSKVINFHIVNQSVVWLASKTSSLACLEFRSHILNIHPLPLFFLQFLTMTRWPKCHDTVPYCSFFSDTCFCQIFPALAADCKERVHEAGPLF